MVMIEDASGKKVRKNSADTVPTPPGRKLKIHTRGFRVCLLEVEGKVIAEKT